MNRKKMWGVAILALTLALGAIAGLGWLTPQVEAAGPSCWQVCEETPGGGLCCNTCCRTSSGVVCTDRACP